MSYVSVMRRQCSWGVRPIACLHPVIRVTGSGAADRTASTCRVRREASHGRDIVPSTRRVAERPVDTRPALVSAQFRRLEDKHGSRLSLEAAR